MKYVKVAVAAMALSAAVVAAQQANKKAVSNKTNEAAIAVDKKSNQSAERQFSPIFYSRRTDISEYKSNDAAKIYKWVAGIIESVPGKPDKFSTSEEKKSYEASLRERFRGVGQIPVIGRCAKKYDADQQRYTVGPSVFSIKQYESIKEIDAVALNVKTLTLLTDNVKHDTYTGQNAYGAETQIKRTVSDNYVVAFPIEKSPNEAMTRVAQYSNIAPKYELDYRSLKFDIQMSPADARANDENIGCLYVFTIEAPYQLQFSERERPTRDMPFDISISYYAVYGSLDIVAVINKADGKIYGHVERKL